MKTIEILEILKWLEDNPSTINLVHYEEGFFHTTGDNISSTNFIDVLKKIKIYLEE